MRAYIQWEHTYSGYIHTAGAYIQRAHTAGAYSGSIHTAGAYSGRIQRVHTYSRSIQLETRMAVGGGAAISDLSEQDRVRRPVPSPSKTSSVTVHCRPAWWPVSWKFRVTSDSNNHGKRACLLGDVHWLERAGLGGGQSFL